MSAVRIALQEGTLVVRLHEPQIASEPQAQEIGEELLQQVGNATHGRMLLDLQGVKFFGSAMIGQIFWLARKCKAENVRFKICNLEPTLKQILDVVNMASIVDIAADLAQAQLAFANDQISTTTAEQDRQASDYQADAESGLAEAQYALAGCYEDGCGVAPDAERAFRWYSKAAEQGLAAAQYCLGRSLAFGIHVPCDYVQSILWYDKAARQGHADAQYMLGVFYQWGIGVAEDRAQAADWYRQAAAQGHSTAAAALAEIEPL
jgi:anti-anti-sigma factor